MNGSRCSKGTLFRGLNRDGFGFERDCGGVEGMMWISHGLECPVLGLAVFDAFSAMTDEEKRVEPGS